MGVHICGVRFECIKNSRGFGGTDVLCHSDGSFTYLLWEIWGKNRVKYVYEVERSALCVQLSADFTFADACFWPVGLWNLRSVSGNLMARLFQHSGKCHPQGRDNAVCVVGVGRGCRMFCRPHLCRYGFFGSRRKSAYGNSGSGNISRDDVCWVLFVEEKRKGRFAVLTFPLYCDKLLKTTAGKTNVYLLCF